MSVTDLHAAGLRRDERLERWKLFGLASPAILLVLVVLVIPVGWLFYVSFVGADGNFSLENYERMVSRKSYLRIFVTTFQVSILTTALCIVIGYPLAYFISQLPTRWANLCLVTVLLPFWTSLLVRTYAWLVLLQKQGLVNFADLRFSQGFADQVENLIVAETVRATTMECLGDAVRLGKSQDKALGDIGDRDRLELIFPAPHYRHDREFSHHVGEHVDELVVRAVDQ